MLSSQLVLSTSFAYVAFLFLIAFLSDRASKSGSTGLLQSPLVYTLSISIYCTSWTFYGAVGSAGRNGLEFVAIYLGPTMVFVGWWWFLRKLVKIGRNQRVTSIADLISSRYGKSTTLAVLATLIAVVGTTPYIALQLKAVISSLEVITGATETFTATPDNFDARIRTAFWVATGMAIFTILFGTRNVDANERHHGVVAAIAVEAIVKLVALLAVGMYVVFAIADGPGELLSNPRITEVMNTKNVFGERWITLTFLAAAAIICLPRQFHVTVVENSDDKQLKTAAWMFPLYLFLISLFILPIAAAGLMFLPANANPDMFVLTLPLANGQGGLALLAFIGGFSSATSMVVVASIALSTMVSNHIVMPIALRLPWLPMDASGDVKRLILLSRRFSICLILGLGFLYYLFSHEGGALASMGLIAFAGVAQFLPSIIGGLFWRNATARGAILGLLGGFAAWAYTLFLPSLAGTAEITASLITNGPWGIGWLKPEALFGLEGTDPLVHAVAWSMSINVILYVIGSLFSDAKPLERLQATLFVDVFKRDTGSEIQFIERSATTSDLFTLAQRVLGRDEASKIFGVEPVEGHNIEIGAETSLISSPEFIARLERRFAGNVGAASARALISRVVTGERITFDAVMKIVDEAQQVIEYSHQLEEKSTELEQTASQLRDANEQLTQIDQQKDDFLSQVSHEMRTPMTSIRSFSDILSNADDLGDEQSQRYLGIISNESERLTRLLDEILEANRLERGELTLNIETVHADEVLARGIDTCQGLANQSGVSIRRSGNTEQIMVSVDPDRLCQIFINILSNAIKYNSSTEPIVDIKSYITGGNYVVEFTDNGPGVPVADGERIFGKFTRLEASASDRPGSGLGLSIGRELARKFGGDLRLVSGPDTGARFVLTVPAV
jgi:Na+/proline symporter/nitrogen-specific signal transduction histidine kinase